MQAFFTKELNSHPERCEANWREAKTSVDITEQDFILEDFSLNKSGPVCDEH